MKQFLFTNLHVHTAQGSLLDSILTIKDLVSFAKDNEQHAIAVTDHGSMNNFVNLVKECNKQGIKPIIGNEIYEVDNMEEKADTKNYTQPRYHLVLLARTQQGFRNLIKITSISRTEGLYKKPRIDIDRICQSDLGKGIICLTACQAGRLSRYLEIGKEREALEFINKLKGTFDYVACELQSHRTEDQFKCNQLIYNFAIKNGIPYTVTTDAHMLNDSLRESHSVFVKIGEGRETGESYVDCYLQTEKDIIEKLKNNLPADAIKTAINETEYIVSMIEDIDIGLNSGNVMPKINIEGDFKSHEEYLRHLVFSTFDEKFSHMSQEEQEERRQRLETELPVLYAVDYTDYFIMLYMLAKEARKRKIPLGYSRGSGANCLCLFMLNVTQVDSVRWGLDFSRFANLGRKSMADYDWDISKKRRKEMIEISEELFGKENVAPICTFNSLSTKVAIRDIGKVLDEDENHPYYQQIPYKLRDDVAKMIPTIKTLNDLGEEEEKDVLLRDILGKNSKLKEVYERFPLWFKYVMDVEGLPKSMGRHAAGTLITPTPITDYCPLCYDSEKNIMIELEMHNAMDDLHLIKMDYLGLETLDIIDDTLKMAGLTWEDVDINHLNLADKQVFDDVYKQGNTVGIFQMESAEARKMCIEAKADNVEDIIVVNAANRPGTKDSFPIYCKNKLNPEDITVIHDDLKELFKNTQCVLLYQEQALQLFRKAGFPEEEIDNARRCIDENSLITMGDGNRKKIKDIKIGELVSCFDEKTRSMTYKPVLNVYDNGEAETYRITTTHDNEIIATKTHKVLTQDGWKKIEELTEDDYIMTPKRLHAYGDTIPSKYKPHSDVMYLIGLLIGDGCLVDKNRIHFTNSEECLVEEFKRCINKISKKNVPCEFATDIQDGIEVNHVYSTYVKKTASNKEYLKRLISLCQKYDLLHEAKNKKIPDEFMHYPVGTLITKLIAGLFNTDGGYNESASTIEYYTTSKILAYQLESLLMKYNINSYVYSKIVKDYDYDTYTLVIKDIESIENFIKKINKYVIGRKHSDYTHIYSLAKERKNKYSYMLPKKYCKEIMCQYKTHGFSFSNLSEMLEEYSNNGFKIINDACITNTKAQKIISLFYCPETYELITSEFIPLKIKTIEKVGKRHVYDIEVKENHNYVANDLIVHNCIGKKDKKKMVSLEVDFRNGLKKQGWNEQQLQEMWNLMLKQSEYCFNRGHAVAYGLLSYLTAYLKVHYSIFFMTALLTSKSDKVEKISVVVNDCKRMGISVSPPDINNSEAQFSAIPEKNEILFGLLGVKGLGDAIVTKIISNRPYNNLDDFIEKVSDKTAIITLIKAGGVPTKNKMKTLKKYALKTFEGREYKPVSSLPKLSVLREEYDIDTDIFKSKEERLRLYNEKKKKQFEETMKNKTQLYMQEFYEKYCQNEYMWEFETLAMFLTNDPLLDANKYIKKQWNDIQEDEKGVVCCVIVDIKRKKDKKGNQFAYLDLYTPSGIIEATIWSKQFKEYSDIVKKGKCVAILGRKREGNHFFVEEMKTYEQWLNDRKLSKLK